MLHSGYKWYSFILRMHFLKNVVNDQSKTFPLLFRLHIFRILNTISFRIKWLTYRLLGSQNWKEIPSSSERSCHSKAWFSIKKDSIVIKTTVFSIWSIFVCGGGGSKKKRVAAFVSKPNPASNLISLRCYIYGDNEDSKRVSNSVRDLATV